MEVDGAPRKYPDELRERAVRMVRDIKAESGSAKGACRRVGDQLGINPETLRGWVNQAEIQGLGKVAVGGCWAAVTRGHGCRYGHGPDVIIKVSKP